MECSFKVLRLFLSLNLIHFFVLQFGRLPVQSGSLIISAICHDLSVVSALEEAVTGPLNP